MNHKELGRRGIQLPEIGLGTWQYRASVELLRRDIEPGAFHTDMPERYGTEEIDG